MDELIQVISVTTDEEVIAARSRVKIQMQAMGFSILEQTRVVTAVSELARNMVVHAKEGSLSIYKITEAFRQGMKVVFTDKGPGIPDINKAMQEGYSTAGSMGLGLQGSKRLVDEFEIKSVVGQGTTITIVKWKQ